MAMNAIYKRRSYHSGFDNESKISDENIKAILKAAMNAPSAMNEQPWEFVVITDPDKLTELSTLTGGTHAAATSSHTILLCASPDESGYQSMNIGMAAENIMLAAADLNIGSLPMGIYPNDKVQEKIRAVVNLPETITAYLMISLGYPNETLPPNNRWLPDKVHNNNW
jgi:nitroreductase